MTIGTRLNPLLLAVAIIFISSCAGKHYPAPDHDINQPVLASYAPAETPFDGRLQVIAFNVERGFFWPDVVNYVDRERADLPATVVLLSETDRNHSRTHDVFVADAMARALSMNMAWVTEYIEYNDQTPENQGDHGNAILSPFPLADVTVIRLPTMYPWEKLGYLRGEPRYGDRVTIGATLLLPGGKKVRVYSTHLESDAETVGKWIQASKAIKDAANHDLPMVLGGDLNEVPGGLMFGMFPLHHVKNAFSGDLSPTGSCKPADGRARCFLKIDWIVYRGLERLSSAVDYPLNSEGGVMSDHVPVRAVFQVK
ncbi:MAG TPA: endonuclease/exonuclease/phosphatase family protein [bacterium]|nr:endonuclease/exonuclease/phosphatase family protein [bacterium]